MKDDEIKQLLKDLWADSKISFVLLLKTLSFVLIFSYFKLGNNILKPLKTRLQKQVRTPYLPNTQQLSELEWFAMYAANIFKYDTVDALRIDYPTDTHHVVGEFRECRYTIMRKGHKVFVAVRGSTTGQNWRDGVTAEVKRGYHKGYYTVAKGIADVISQYADRYDEIYITGGSMGGAVSILVGWLLDDRGYNLKKIWAFANPKVSERDYGHLPVINVFDMRDPVVYMPSFTLIGRYRHQGKRLAYVEGQWWMYEDNWRTDMLLSVWFMSEPIDFATHTQYGERLLELKDAVTRNAE